MSLEMVLNRATLLVLAGERSFSRGAVYAAEGRVEGLSVDGDLIVAEVQGTNEYHVELWIEDGELYYDCDCPVGLDGACCKHCVAVGLTWLDQQTGETGQAATATTSVTLDNVRAYLRTLTPEALIELLMTQVHHDPDLREQLLLRVARASASGIDLPTFRKALDRAITIRDYVDYGGAGSYASGVERILTSLEEMLEEGYAEEALSLVEYAIPLLDEAINNVDDSDGYLNEVIERIQELHHAACEAVRPDPEALARQLFSWETNNGFIDFGGAAAVYADLLGKSGLATYRALLETEWERLPALAPGESDFASFQDNRWRITFMKESLARATGDVDAVVAVKSRDLSHAHTFYQITQLYQEAGRHDDALAWAERGMQAFPDRADVNLRNWLVEEYHRRERHAEAMAIVWNAFTEHPALASYQQLADHAGRIGEWPRWRERAWEVLRDSVKRTQAPRGYYWAPYMGHSTIVEILLWEGNDEEAWQEAQLGGCIPALWLELAKRRTADHPEDALQVYQNRIKPTLDQTNNSAYEEAMNLLRKCREILQRLGREKDFTDYVTALRVEYKRKRNFIKLLDATRWG